MFSFLLPVSALLHGGPKYLLVEKDANFGCLSSLPSPLRLGQTLQEQIWQDLSLWTLTINFKHLYMYTGEGQRIKMILLAVGVMMAMFGIVVMMMMMTKTMSSQE